MPNYRRPGVRGGTYFFTVVTHGRQPVLTQDVVRQALREGIAAARAIMPFKIEAWVLLPDHLHCIWTLPEGDSGFSARWGIIKRHVTKRCAARMDDSHRLSASRRSRREKAIWQRRFWEHLVRDDTDFNHHVDYVHWNPVKHGYARRAADWPYSTFRRYVAQGSYPSDWGGENFSEGADSSYGE